jgi:hypothetical protein
LAGRLIGAVRNPFLTAIVRREGVPDEAIMESATVRKILAHTNTIAKPQVGLTRDGKKSIPKSFLCYYFSN